jgi:hypothetical protein
MQTIFSTPRRLAAVFGLLVAALAGCSSGPSPAPPREAGIQAAWTTMVPEPEARAIVAAGSACPSLVVDGRAQTMALRVAAGTAPQRPTVGQPTKPAEFPVSVCAARLAPGARAVSVGGHALPMPHAEPQRIVVIGDTGCRISGSTGQACKDLDAWPFAKVAATAATFKPDLVLHVGDYHYRETPCPAGLSGCQGSPWGYGWDAWQADFFAPAAPLLAAAPWVFVRGNHEECNRAGQGWFRWLAPEPYTATRSCDDPAHDDDANFSPAYAVPLGGGLQLLVFDSAHAGNLPLNMSRPEDALIFANYQKQMRDVGLLASAPGMQTWFTSHHPVLGFAPDKKRPGNPYPGNQALQSAMTSLNGEAYFPPGVGLALHGHVHLLQAITFATRQPPTLVAGNGGDNVDENLPDPLPPTSSPAPGSTVAEITHSSHFGFLLLRRVAGNAWSVEARDRDGSLLSRCALAGDGALHCTPSGWLR